IALGGGLPTTSASTTRYLTGAATTGDVSDDVAATGTIATTRSYGLAFGSAPHIADSSSSSSSSNSGTGSTTWTVTQLKAAVGQTVTAGEVLAKAGTTDLQRQLADAEAALANAKIQQSMAQDTLDNATSTAQTQQATISLNQATTQVSDARKTKTDLINQI